MAFDKIKPAQTDVVVVFRFSAQDECELTNGLTVLNGLGETRALFLHRCLELAWVDMKRSEPAIAAALFPRLIRLRVCPDVSRLVILMPHEILLQADLLDYTPADRADQERFVIGLLSLGLVHLANANWHITQLTRYGLRYYQARPEIRRSTLERMQRMASHPTLGPMMQAVIHADELLQIESFWRWLGGGEMIVDVFGLIHRSMDQCRDQLGTILKKCAREHALSEGLPVSAVKRLSEVSHLYVDGNSLVVVYELHKQALGVVRIASDTHLDPYACPEACSSVRFKSVRTDLFHDTGPFLLAWLARLKTYQEDPALGELARMLISGHVHTVNAAIDELRIRIQKGENLSESLRLLYAALYYWYHSNKGISRSVCLRTSNLLEDILTERPAIFPRARVNRSYFRGEPPVIRIHIRRPGRVNIRNIQARVQWSVNGSRKKPVPMIRLPEIESSDIINFETHLPSKNGWIHYSVQVSLDGGKNWDFEKFDEYSHGLLKRVADERGQRVLSIYADTFNLKLDASLRPVRDETGTYVYGTFDDLAAQLPDLRKEGYTRIYPLGALELGWAGEAGPDPSVFSIYDGHTIRRDLGGIEGLLRLRKRADELGMKILLCVLSHFSRAFHSWPYELPVYIVGPDGNLTRRAGWDGHWDEWLDSFMVNMRDLDNIEYLVNISKELTELGFGLRVDVGHGFDTVFPVRHDLPDSSRLFGPVTVKGFEPIDLRGTNEPNIPLLYMCYRVQKAVPGALIAYSEQWHGNEVRMIKAGTIPYNALIKNLENIHSGQAVEASLGLNNNLNYLGNIYRRYGGQTLSLFNSHDEESPASNYQNMIWPAAGMLVLSSYGPLMYHISRLPGSESGSGSFSRRFDAAYTECWKHWVNNRFSHPWQEENQVRENILRHYPYLRGFGAYLRGLYTFVDENPVLSKGSLIPLATHNGRIAAFLRCLRERKMLCVFNFPNPYPEGQQAVARPFNLLFRDPASGHLVVGIDPDQVYELRERYNNVEGKMRFGQREYWSGHELAHLGFGGVLPPVSTRVFELLEKEQAVPEKQVLFDSFRRYMRYGRADRARHCYAARVFAECCLPDHPDFDRFGERFAQLIRWIHSDTQFGAASFGTLLTEISDNHPPMRDTVIQFLMRIAVNEADRFDAETCRSAADILQSINIGTIVLVSPESKFSGSSGGVGLYTTDIADTLSELGFHIVLITPLYESNREYIHAHFAPQFDGYHFTVRFPDFNDQTQTMLPGSTLDVVNILRSHLVRRKYGKRSRIDVLYLENAAYLDRPYSGNTAEDKIRRTRILSQGALEALRCYNYYPSIIQTNEWPCWLTAAYLMTWKEFRDDPHFAGCKVGSMMHNPHPSYGIVLNEANPVKRHYYCWVMGLDPNHDYDIAVNRASPNGHPIELMHTMLKTSSFIGTVSKAMKERMMRENWLFGHAHEFQEKDRADFFFARRNGFNMAARQRFWFGTRKSIVETYQPSARRRLFYKYYAAKKTAKINLQNDPAIRLTPDSPDRDHVIFSMLHRISRQKGFELLVDWKVYSGPTWRDVRYEEWNMGGNTVLEHLLVNDPRIQFVICGRVEDSPDGRRFDMHLRRIASREDLRGRFAYYPEGNLNSALYRNVYVGAQYFVMPSGGEVGEPCGISQQEAHAGGTPVVAHHQDGLQYTVSDSDFGDKDFAPNGIKFTGFTGQALLDALLDAVEIYFSGCRRNYRDEHGNPKKLDYDELVFNAFTRDHRWVRPLRDYVQMYAHVLGTRLPDHLDALRIIEATARVENSEMGDVILRFGLTISQSIACFIYAMGCPVPSVRQRSADTLLRLLASVEETHLTNHTMLLLREAKESANPDLAEFADYCLRQLQSPPDLPEQYEI